LQLLLLPSTGGVDERHKMVEMSAAAHDDFIMVLESAGAV
jgi:hypothetical protein